MEIKWMLLPMMAQILLTAYVYVLLYRRRVHAVVVDGFDPLYFKTKQQGEPSRILKQTDDLLVNLFEAPVIMYAGGLAAMILDQVDAIMIGLASIYVLCRVLHAVECLGGNSIRRRFRPWVTSQIILLSMWTWLLISAFVDSI